MTTEYHGQLRLNQQLEEGCKRVAARAALHTEGLTEAQLTEALIQAIKAGDFRRMVRISDNAQAVTYMPFLGHDELCSENLKLKAQIDAIRKALDPSFGLAT